MPAPSVAELSAEHFRPHLHEAFGLEVAPELRLDVRLIEVTETSRRGAPGGRAPFSLLFLAPTGSPNRQGVFVLMHPVLGRFELFATAVAPTQDGARYEIVLG